MIRYGTIAAPGTDDRLDSRIIEHGLEVGCTLGIRSGK